jgi:hypothetical protein
VWDSEIVPMLEAAPGIRAVAIFEEICRWHPESAARASWRSRKVCRTPGGRWVGCRNYRHVIHALHKKPMALRNLVYRELFPRRAYARAFEALLAKESEKHAYRTMAGLLALAHDRTCEVELAHVIDADLDAGCLPDLNRLRDCFKPDRAVIPDVA